MFEFNNEFMNKYSNYFERIMQIIEYKGFSSVNDFAKNGLKYASSEKINRLKDKNKHPSVEILLDISNMFEDINPEWLLTGKGSMIKETKENALSLDSIPKSIKVLIEDLYNNNIEDRKNTIPLVLTKAIGGFGSETFSISEQDVKDYYIIPKFMHKKIDFMIEVEGSSMYPKYSSGDIVACRIIDEKRFIQWNKTHVVATKDQGIIIKRLKKGSSDESFLLVSDNPSYDPFEITHDDITGVALVIGVIRLE